MCAGDRALPACEGIVTPDAHRFSRILMGSSIW